MLIPNSTVLDTFMQSEYLFTEEVKTRAGDVTRRKIAYNKGGNLVAASDAH